MNIENKDILSISDLENVTKYCPKYLGPYLAGLI